MSTKFYNIASVVSDVYIRVSLKIRAPNVGNARMAFSTVQYVATSSDSVYGVNFFIYYWVKKRSVYNCIVVQLLCEVFELYCCFVIRY